MSIMRIDIYQKRPRVKFVTDRGSEGYKEAFELIYHGRLRAHPVFDQFHLNWRTAVNALQGAKFWGSMAKSTHIFDAPKGPWLSGAFLEQFKEALQNFIADWKTNRPYWDTFHEQICDDLDISIDTSCDEVLQMLVDEKTLELTGPYVTMDELWIVFFCSRACNVDVATKMKFRRITAYESSPQNGTGSLYELECCMHAQAHYMRGRERVVSFFVVHIHTYAYMYNSYIPKPILKYRIKSSSTHQVNAGRICPPHLPFRIHASLTP